MSRGLNEASPMCTSAVVCSFFFYFNVSKLVVVVEFLISNTATANLRDNFLYWFGLNPESWKITISHAPVTDFEAYQENGFRTT